MILFILLDECCKRESSGQHDMLSYFSVLPGFTDETPRDYHCNLGPDGRRRDADERPELCKGTVEFVATKEYTVSRYFFVYNYGN